MAWEPDLITWQRGYLLLAHFHKKKLKKNNEEGGAIENISSKNPLHGKNAALTTQL